MPTKHGPKADKFYHSTAWTKARNAYIQLKNGRCEICGKRGNLVHHRTPITEENIDDPNITLNFDNYMLLCIDCHNKIHADMENGQIEKPTIVKFDENGNVIVYEKDNRKDNDKNEETRGN